MYAITRRPLTRQSTGLKRNQDSRPIGSFLTSLVTMSLSSLYAAFAEHLQSPQFHAQARHAGHPNAFRRERKLPLPCLLATILGGMRKSVRVELGEFFGHLQQQAQLAHHVSERALARARAKLAATLVAADASTLCFGLRTSTVANPASADQIAFSLFLPGAERRCPCCRNRSAPRPRAACCRRVARR